MQQRDQRLLNWACLPPGTLLSLLIGWINQSFMCRLSHFSTDWQLHGRCQEHNCSSLASALCAAEPHGALEFVTTTHVLCSPHRPYCGLAPSWAKDSLWRHACFQFFNPLGKEKKIPVAAGNVGCFVWIVETRDFRFQSLLWNRWMISSCTVVVPEMP